MALEAESIYSLALRRKFVNLWTREESGGWGHILEGDRLGYVLKAEPTGLIISLGTREGEGKMEFKF